MPDHTVVLIVGYLLALGLLVGGFLFLRGRLASSGQPDAAEAQEPQPGDNAPNRRPRRPVAQPRRRAADVAEVKQPEQPAPAAADNDEDKEGADEGDDDGVGGKLTKADKKKLEKQQRKQHEADKKRQADERQEKRARQDDKVAEKRRAKQEQREAEETAAAAAAAAIALEEKKKQDEEDAQWTGEIELEQAGESAPESSQESEQLLLNKFVLHIQTNKVVVLDELAGQFNMRTQDVLSRIETLQKEGQLTGVLDDRGKFLYITRDELEAVARFVKRRGRVTISDVVAESNKLINLSPSAVDDA